MSRSAATRTRSAWPARLILLVSIGRDNAIAVYRYENMATPVQFEGLLPTDWYPCRSSPTGPSAARSWSPTTRASAVAASAPSTRSTRVPATLRPQYRQRPQHLRRHRRGDELALPHDDQLARETAIVFADNGWNHLGGRAADDVSAVVPNHIGGRSPIKHVFVIIKENRTYDQVLGDMPQGNGDPTDA